MAGGLAITRRVRVRGLVLMLSAGEASLEEEEPAAVLLVLAKGLISSTGRETALHLLTGGAFSGAAVSAAFPTAAILNAPDETPFLNPAAAEEESLSSSSSSAATPNADLRAIADADGLAALPAAALGLLRAVGAKRSAADQVAAGVESGGQALSPWHERRGTGLTLWLVAVGIVLLRLRGCCCCWWSGRTGRRYVGGRRSCCRGFSLPLEADPAVQRHSLISPGVLPWYPSIEQSTECSAREETTKSSSVLSRSQETGVGLSRMPYESIVKRTVLLLEHGC